MKIYRTGQYDKLIEIVEVDRATEKSVWINGRTIRKRSNFYSYWNTVQDAKEHLLKKLEEKIQVHKIHIQSAQKEIELINKKF